jgi:hypothetical protein
MFALLPAVMGSCEKNGEDIIYTKLDGIYSCEETSLYSAEYKKYLVEIDKVSSAEDQYIISNFRNQGDTEFLFVQYRNDSIYIENQVIAGLFINGKGTVNNDLNKIELSYFADDGSLEIQYFAIFSR